MYSLEALCLNLSCPFGYWTYQINKGKDIPVSPTSLHRGKRVTSICDISVTFHIELIAPSFFLFFFFGIVFYVLIDFHSMVSFTKTGQFWKLNPLLGACDQLKTCAIRVG